MSLADDIKNDWQIFDEVELVTIVANSGDGQPIRNVRALKRRLSWTDIGLGAGLGLTNASRAWNIWRATMVRESEDFRKSYVPKNGDYLIQADGTTWTIGSADLVTLDTRLHCLCTPQIDRR